jgi:hypothetical protein
VLPLIDLLNQQSEMRQRGEAMTKPLSGAQMIALRNCARQDGYCRAYVSQYSRSTFDALERRGLIELRGVVYVTTDKGDALLARRTAESDASVESGHATPPSELLGPP